MKTAAILITTLAAANAFAPMQQGRVNTDLMAEKVPLFERIFNMDLFEPVKEQNNYGARNKKSLSVGKIGSSSYVPSGLSASEYQKIRDGDVAKSKANYERNVKKAGIFEDFTDFYLKRGTDTSQSWIKAPTRGHRMVKLKYDGDASTLGKKYDGKA